MVDDEARRIAIDAQNQVYDLLDEHRNQVDALASALLEHGTLDQHDAYRAVGVPLDTARSASPLAQG
jgi:cell division protease FtsH